MAGVLLDTHVLYWLVSGEKQLSDNALIVIGESQMAGELFVSPITAWELSIAAQKPAERNPPQFRRQFTGSLVLCCCRGDRREDYSDKAKDCYRGGGCCRWNWA